MNALNSIGTKIATAMVAAGLVAGAAFAGEPTVTVNLPQSVNVGGSTLPSGQYTITESDLSGGVSVFVFRDDKGNAASAVGTRNADPAVDQKTAVVLSNTGDGLRLNKIFIGGNSVGYQFEGK